MTHHAARSGEDVGQVEAGAQASVKHVDDRAAVEAVATSTAPMRSLDFETIATWEDLPDDLEAPIVLYCRSGKMCGQAAVDLSALGYTNIVDLKGGMNAWVGEGYELLDDLGAVSD